MAASLETRPCLLLLVTLLASASWAQINVDDKPQLINKVVHVAFDFVNAGRRYSRYDLVSVDKSAEPPYIIYSVSLILEPVCRDSAESCPRETCVLDVRQNQQGVIDVLKDSIVCMILQSQPKHGNTQEQEIVENIEKQIINQSISLDHEVQTSADHNDRPFIAVRASQSDYCPGCPYELNASLPGLSAFRDQVLKSMDEAGISDFKHKLISIIRVTRAVPPNNNIVQYQLLMEIGESTCLRTSLIEISECPLQSNLPIKLCFVTFEEQPWHSGSRKITKNNCTELLNTDNEVSASVDPNSLLFESLAPHKEDDPSTKTEFYDQIAQEAQEVFRVPSIEIPTKDSNGGLAEITTIISDKLEENKSSIRFSPEKMKEFDEFLGDFNIPIKTETTTSKYLGVPVKEVMIKEHVEEKSVGEQIDASNGKPVQKTVNINEELQQRENPIFRPTVESVRSKRSPTGALEDDEQILYSLAKKAVKMIDDLDEDDKKKNLIGLMESKKEKQDHIIVYHMTVEVAATDCNEKDKSTECLDEVIPGPTQICKFDVVTDEKTPLEISKLLHYDCNKNEHKSVIRFKRQLEGALDIENPPLGGARPHKKDDPEIQKYVQLGLRKFSETSEGTNEPIVSEIKDVTVQVVSGLLYKIKTDIGVSTCKKGNNENCQLKADEGVKECIIEVWSQPWLDKGNPKITVKCNQNRRKRSLRGKNYSEKMLEQSRQLKEGKLFHEFIRKFNKNYDTEEEKDRRFKIFKENLDMIEELQRNEQGTGRYGVTMFTDLTKAEFKAKYLGLKPSLKSENDIPMPMADIPDIELPPEYDWRHYNVVTPVKDQGSCGSCWAFSVTGNIEGLYALKHGKLLSFSEQELVDCDKLDEGCNGGLPDKAYRAIEELGGLEAESDYPYDGENEKCHFNKNKIKVSIVSGLNITSNETKMAQWLVQNGPISIGINANAMQFYMGGVSHPFKFLCSPDSLDHGVLIVGYGTRTYPIFKKSMPYWLIKNSWGPGWGEQGYYRVYRGDGTCGVNKMATSAVVA